MNDPGRAGEVEASVTPRSSRHALRTHELVWAPDRTRAGRVVSAALLLAAASLAGCAATLEVTRTRPPPIGPTDERLAVAASGPYAPELIAHVRAALEKSVKVESCVLGCPAVGLYASLSLGPGPHEGRTRRTCQAEVYTGPSWAAPKAIRGTFLASVERPEECFSRLTAWLASPREERVRVRLDETGPQKDIAALARGGRLDEARARLEALTAGEGSAGAWFNLAVVLEAQGHRDEARRAWRQALTLDPPPWMRAAIDEGLAAGP